jgi:zinc D-Ala-D-Ala carboxypeptidase
MRLHPTAKAESLWVVVNKKRRLNPVAYAPVLDTKINLAPAAATAFWALKAEIQRQGLGTLCLNSGYRSYGSQTSIHSARVAALGKVAGENLAARPGHSEHQTGLAADVSITSLGCRIGAFGSTDAYRWIVANGHKYGFIVRYPWKLTEVTGYVWEPWHLRFVGKELATEMKTRKIKTLEQFFGLPSAPSY